jgi:serine/threonine protein kinase
MSDNNDAILNKIGGKVIASGGFGCVFEPALKCEGEEDNERGDEGKVSKLMMVKYANREYNDTQKYKKLLERIPNYRDYFLIDGFSICKPAPLSKGDLKGYKTKCKALHKKNVTRKRINKHLDELKMINMPYGGEDLGDYIEKNCTPTQFAKINDALIKLLENGIQPMNAIGIYHLDIKESNILIDISEQRTPIVRLIDWGLSCTYKKGENVPDVLTRRSFQYNAPMSIIILHTKFEEMYDELLIDAPSPDYEVVQEFVSNYVLEWFEKRGIGHFKIVHEILEELFKKRNNMKEPLKPSSKSTSKSTTNKETSSSSSADYLTDTSANYSSKPVDKKYVVTYNLIINYITDILVQYTFEGKSNTIKYFKDVFIKNVDIYGFIMAYSPILEYYCNNYSKLGQHERKIYTHLRDIFVNYLYASPLNTIDTSSLAFDLRKFSQLLREASAQVRHSSSLKNKSTFTDSTVLEENAGPVTKESDKKIMSTIVDALFPK